MTDHLTAIIDAATCTRPVECMRGHSDWCRAARKVAVRDALRLVFGATVTTEALGEAGAGRRHE